MRQLAPAFLCGAIVLSCTYVADIRLPLPGGRSAGPSRIVDDFTSIFSKSQTSISMAPRSGAFGGGD